MTAIYTFSATGAGTYTVPAGATTMTAEAWGGGGSGGGSSTGTAPGGGGGGYSKFTVAVTPAQSIYYNVGAGGTGGGFGVGVAGGNSWVNPSSNAQPSSGGCVGGGGGAAGSSTGGSAGTGTIGTTNFSGGSGASTGGGTNGGAGGGGAGSAGNGSNGSGTTGGAGGSPDGGNGGTGVHGNPTSSFPPGGGGGGSWVGSGDGVAAAGKVRLTFDTTQTLAIDGVAIGAFAGASSGTATLSTLVSNDVIVLMFYGENNVTAQPSVSSVTSSHLTWSKRSAYSVSPGSETMTVEIWWATATSPLTSEVITVTLTGSTHAAAFQVFGIAGCINYNSPWDINASLSSAHLNNSSLAGNTIGTISGVNTNAVNNILVGMWGDGYNADATLPGSLTAIVNPTHIDGATLYAYAQAFYQLNGSALSSASYAFTNAAFGNFAIVLDAINGDAGSIPNKIIEITRGAAYRASYF